MARKWIQKAIKRPGAFTAKAKRAGKGVQEYARHVLANKGKFSTRTVQQANLAKRFGKGGDIGKAKRKKKRSSGGGGARRVRV